MWADEEMRANEGDLFYGVEQDLPVSGKQGLARQVQEAGRTREQANAEFEFQSKRRDLAIALFDAALARRILEIGEEDLVWLRQMVATTEGRLRVGEGSLVELLRMQNERDQQADRLRTARAELDHAHFVLNRLLNQPTETSWPVLRLPSPAATIHYSAALAELALQNEPWLRVLREEVRQAEAAGRLARRQRIPNLSLGAQARNDSRSGEFRQAEFMLGFNLPLGNARKYRRDVEREQAQAAAAEADAADYALGVREEVHRLTVDIDAARRKARLHGDEIGPRSRQAFQSAQAAWISGRGSFLEVMEARRLLLESQRAQAEAVALQYQKLSELVLCCGLGDLEALDKFQL
jgi:outer membrane protein TolC